MTNQILVEDSWVDGEPTYNGQKYRVKIKVGDKYGYEYKIHAIDSGGLPVIYIDIPNSGSVINLGSTFDFTCTFSDKAINGNIPVSVVNRDGIHVENLLITVVDGDGVGSFTPPQPIDYFVTDEAINFHKEVIPNELKLTNEFHIRVVQSI